MLVAGGRYGEASAPFTSRPLVPLLAGGLSDLAHLKLLWSFLAISIASAVIFFACSAGVFAFHNLNALQALPLILLPASLIPFRDIYLPDAISAALTALVFLLLLYERSYAVPVVIFAAIATRESSLVLALMVSWMLVSERHRVSAVALATAVVAGFLAVSAFAGRPMLMKCTLLSTWV